MTSDHRSHSSVACPIGVRGGSGPLGGTSVEETRRLSLNLPPSHHDIGTNNAVAVGVWQEDGWTTRVYDKTRLASEVRDLMKAVQVLIP